MCLTIDDLFPLYPSISPVSQTDRGIACVVWVAGRVWQYTIRFYLFFCFVSLCHGAFSYTFQFSFRTFGEWNIIYMFLWFSVFIYFYHFQISVVEMIKKKKWEFFRIFIVMFLLKNEISFYIEILFDMHSFLRFLFAFRKE